MNWKVAEVSNVSRIRKASRVRCKGDEGSTISMGIKGRKEKYVKKGGDR